MKNILLPTDFSQNSFNAISYTIDMFRDEKVKFTLLHAYKVFEYYEKSMLAAQPGQQSLEKAKKEVEDELEELKESLQEEAGKEHQFKTTTHNLLLVDAIKKELKKQKPYLISIGTQGRTGAKEVVYGSNTLNVMEEIEKCPILAIPAHAGFKPPKEIVLANSFKIELTSVDLEFLVGLARKFGSAIRILHISEEGGLNQYQHYNRKQLQEKLAEVKHSFHYLEYLSVPMGIYSFSESRGSDIIAFVNKKHSLIENMLLNPLYRNLAHFSKVPVLVLHHPQIKKN
ncbi:universal stress protein [Salinimicrobium xinjiangense]|uniref:universal stress protein n=1 Tax=Salinimicrobium xinjiangense TaxID=438596 RepID=UPI000490193C|nr:universal stress protein [Salinimicrobium xinjiangense]